MIERIKRLKNLQEGVLVIMIGLGLFIYSSLTGLYFILTGSSNTRTYFLSENGTMSIVVFEIISLTVIALILSTRGWRIIDLNLRISFRIVVEAVLLLLAALFVSGFIYRLITYILAVDTDVTEPVIYEIHKNYAVWVLILIVNSIFEEFIYVGYLFKKLGKQNHVVFIILSSTLRTIVHLYQGVFAIIPHFIFGLFFGLHYARYRKLTVLIIAHALYNLLVLWRIG